MQSKSGYWPLAAVVSVGAIITLVVFVSPFKNLTSRLGMSAAAYNAVADGNWSDAATWGGSGVPGAGDSVTIEGKTVTLAGDVELGGDLTIGTGGVLNMGTYSIHGIFYNVNINGGTLNGGSGALRLEGGGTENIGLHVTGGAFVAPATVELTDLAPGGFTHAGGTTDWTTNSSSLRVEYTGSTGTSAIPTGANDNYYNLSLAPDRAMGGAGGWTMDGDLTVTGTLTIASPTENGGSYTFNTGANTLDVGNLVIEDSDGADLANTVNVDSGGTLRIGGNFSSTNNFAYLAVYGQLIYYGTDTDNAINTGGANLGEVVRFDGVGGEWKLLSGITYNTAATPEIVNGTLDLNGQAVSLGTRFGGAVANFSNAGTLKLKGDEAITLEGSSTLIDPDSGTTEYYGSGAHATLVGGNSYYDLKFSGGGTWTLDANLTVHDLTIDTGTTLVANGKKITVSGDFTNNGTFTAGSGTVLLNGTSQTLIGATTFNNLIATTSDQIITFPASVTTTVSGTLTVEGTSGHNVVFKSSEAGTDGQKTDKEWDLVAAAVADSSGNAYIQYLTVYDSDASGAASPIALKNSVSGGNNTGWGFPTISAPTFSSVTSSSMVVTAAGVPSSGLAELPYQFHNTTDDVYSGPIATKNWTASDLKASTAYTFEIGITDANGNVATSTTATRSTSAASRPADPVPQGEEPPPAPEPEPQAEDPIVANPADLPTTSIRLGSQLGLNPINGPVVPIISPVETLYQIEVKLHFIISELIKIISERLRVLQLTQ